MTPNLSSTLLATITIKIDKYCVYTHSLGGEVFYVGKGFGGRPFDSHARNPNWMAIATGAGAVDVTIVGWYESEIDAIEMERYLINKLQPIANMHGMGDIWRSKKSLVRRGNKYFPCIRNVARLTDYGNIDGLDRFEVILRRHLGVASGDHLWKLPVDWAKAYDDYFFKPGPVYAARRDKVCGPRVKVRARGKRKKRRKTSVLVRRVGIKYGRVDPPQAPG